MASGYAPVDVITDQTGDKIAVSVIGDLVCLRVNEKDDTPMVWLNAEDRDRFAKAWAEAERRAEADGVSGRG